jgi:hypothetical protein
VTCPPIYPYWELASKAAAELPGTKESYQPKLQYAYTWRLTHDEDNNPVNNESKNGFDTFGGNLTGSMLASHPGLLANKLASRRGSSTGR